MKTREFRLLIAFVAVITIIGASYAVTLVTVQNTSFVKTGLNIFMTQPTSPSTTPLTTCPVDGSIQYKNTGFTNLFWNITAGDPGLSSYFCIDNQGSVQDQIQISITNVSPAGQLVSGACPNSGGALMNYVTNVPTADTPLPPHTATTTPVSVNICAGGNEALGSGPTFTVNVQ